MLGAIIGDIVGSVYEFRNHRSKVFEPFFHPNAFYTDDTICTVAVATLVQRYGGNEDQVIAALLHDVLEDGGPQWADPIRDAFGGQVLDLVQFCTDGLPDAQGQKSPWRERKERYLAHLRAAEGEGVLVSACDKLANLQAILLDLTEIGESVWSRFTGGKDGSLWYYAELIDAFGGRVPVALEVALRRDLAAVLELAEAKSRVA